jgi:putative endonuclease
MVSHRRGNKRRVGDVGEQIAVDFLVSQGYQIVGRNFAERFGEVDIVAWHSKIYFGETLCFIEVKYRATNDGSAERAVGSMKQQHMKKGAIAFCLEHGIDSEHTPIQFEQVSIYGKGSEQEIFHYELPQS